MGHGLVAVSRARFLLAFQARGLRYELDCLIEDKHGVLLWASSLAF